MLGGVALVVPLILLPGPSMGFLVGLAVGLLRERAQHRDEPWPDWLTRHRLLEAAGWGVGGSLAGLLAYLG